jgi:putative phosphoribosyl transferase
LDVVLAHKLRSPHQPELAFGAVDENGRVYLNHHVSEAAGVTEAYLASERQIQFDEIKRRRQLLRLGKPAASMAGRSVILTDDGIATGSTVFAAIEVIKAERPHELIVAVPVAPARKLGQLRQKCDHVVVLVEPQDFMAVSQFYQSFLPVSDQQVVDLLNRHRSSLP